MIPKIREVPKTLAPIGQPARHKSLIKVGGLGAGIGDDSAMIAYIKIGSMAMVSALVSYFVVPLTVRAITLISSSCQVWKEL